MRGGWRTLAPLGVGLISGAALGRWGPGPGAGHEHLALGLSVVGLLFALVAWSRWKQRRAVRAAALVLGALGFSASQGWFGGHPGTGLHPTDFFHYELGARYAEELGYTGLYACTVAALQEEHLDLSGWHVRRLVDNEVLPVPALAPDAAACRARFSAERWAAFASEVHAWRVRVGPRHVRTALTDHGFNGTPPWVLLPRLLLSLVGLAPERVALLRWVDTLLVAGAGWLLLRAFGPRTFAVVMLFLGTHAPSRWDWVGGSLLRMDWWAWLAVGLWALKRSRPRLGGAALVAATAMRLFPGLALAGLGLSAVVQRLGAGRRGGAAWQALGAAVVVGLALALAPMAWLPENPWPAFVRNTQKHTRLPGLNHTGLGMALTHVPGARLGDAGPGDEAGEVAWGEARRAALEEDRPRQALVVLLAVVALGWAARFRRSLADAASAGLALFPLVLVASCYYSSALALVFVAARRSRALAVAFMGTALAGQLLQATTRTTAALPMDAYFAVHSGLDAALVVGTLAVLAWRAWPRGQSVAGAA